MSTVKNILVAVVILLINNNVFSQNNIVINAHFSPPTAVLQNGNIAVQTHYNQESVTVALNLERWSDKVSSQLQAEGYFVLDINSDELVLSPVVTFTNSDYVPSFSILSQTKLVTITFKANLVKIGKVKFKFREKLNGVWTSYRYSTQNYNTAYYIPPTTTPPSEFTGPSSICNEEIYTITHPGTISLNNASGIAVLTKINENTYKVTRLGTANGVVSLRSQQGSVINKKEISVGNVINGYISGPGSMRPGQPYEFEIILKDAPSNYSNLHLNQPSGTILLERTETKVKVMVRQDFPFYPGTNEETISVTATANTTCGTASISIPVIVFDPHLKPKEIN